MPYRNGLGAPRFIYRIDSRPPSEIFEEGFQTWGSNTNFFEHILGRSLGDDIQEVSRSGIISASDSPDSSLRFFGGMLTNPLESLEYYLYEIRADENVYSAQRTASFYNQRINSGSIDFEEGDLEIAIDAVDAIIGDFAYQREWFNVGNIPRERVRSAWRVDSVPINSHHIRHQRNVHFTARINDPEHLNSHYVNENTFANELPYTEGATIATTSRLSVPSELVEADASGGVAATLGFACSPSASPPHSRDKRSLNSERKMICYYDKGTIHRSLKKHTHKPYIFSDALPFKMYLKGLKSNKEFVLSTNKKEMNSNALLTEVSRFKNAPDFTYDCFQCLTWNPNKEFSLALTPIYSGFQNFYNLGYKIAAINDDLQKWRLQIIKNGPSEILLRIVNQGIRNFSVQRNLTTNEISLRPINNHDTNFEDLYIVISQNRCDDCVLLPQESDTKLVDLQLSWFYQNQNYVLVPESGLSNPAAPLKNRFFYDLKSYKIIYIDNKGRISALFNDRKKYKWNWARWISSNLQKTDDKRLKWYFVNLKWKDTNDLNYRNIMSFDRNDFLRVMVYGINWGKIYTTPLKTDINSIALFRINPDADV